MDRLDIGTWLELGKSLGEIEQSDIKIDNVQSVLRLYNTVESIEQIQKHSIPELTTSKAVLAEFVEALERVADEVFDAKTNEKKISNAKISLVDSLKKMESILLAELKIADVYAVGQKRIYSTKHLIERAEQCFSSDIQDVLPEQARKDFREAGRCIAFELPTAAGFHAMRATERVLREWYSKVIQQARKKTGVEKRD